MFGCSKCLSGTRILLFPSTIIRMQGVLVFLSAKGRKVKLLLDGSDYERNCLPEDFSTSTLKIRGSVIFVTFSICHLRLIMSAILSYSHLQTVRPQPKSLIGKLPASLTKLHRSEGDRHLQTGIRPLVLTGKLELGLQRQ